MSQFWPAVFIMATAVITAIRDFSSVEAITEAILADTTASATAGSGMAEDTGIRI